MSKHHFRVGIVGKGNRPPVCLGCHRPVLYGDRCADCRRKLQLRKRRKPR